MKREQMAADEAHRQSLAPPAGDRSRHHQATHEALAQQQAKIANIMSKPRKAVIHRDPRTARSSARPWYRRGKWQHITKYNQFVEDLAKAVHNFGTHTFKVALSNGTPDATHATLSQHHRTTTANGYTAGGLTDDQQRNASAGTLTVVAADPAAWTASGAGITFRYAVFYNDTPTSPADPLVAYWDNGSSTTVTSGNTLQVDFGATLFTLA